MNTYGGGREPSADAESQNGHRLGTAQRVLNQTHLPASTLSTYGANAQVDAQRLEVREPLSGSLLHTPEIDTGRSTPFTPTPSNSTSPSPAPGGVGSYEPNPPSADDVRAAAHFKYGA